MFISPAEFIYDRDLVPRDDTEDSPIFGLFIVYILKVQ